MRKLLLLSGILAFLGIQFANADTEVRIINVVGSAAVGDTGWIQCMAASCNFTGSVGHYDIVSDLTIQQTASNPLLDMAYSGSTRDVITGAGTIIIEGMANGYAVNTSSFELIDSGSTTFDQEDFSDAAYGGNNNTICASGASSCWDGTSNPAPNGTNSATSAIGPIFNRGTPWHVDEFGPGNSVNPYSLGLVVTFANVGCGIPIEFCLTGTFNGDTKIDAPVPEPASVMLLGGVLLFAAAGLRRRTRRT